METKILVIASQDYESANHKGLWEKLAEKSNNDVIVINIPADRIVSTLTHHKDRIDDAKKGPNWVKEHLTIYRPLLTVRPEALPDCMFPYVAKEFWGCLDRACPELKQCKLRILVYNAFWVKILKGTRKNISFAYYLFDEVRNNGNDNSVNKKRYAHDEFACKNSEIVLTMSRLLAESRAEYNNNIITIGNGALKPETDSIPIRKFDRSFAFVGNFRDWIDQELLTGLIQLRKDILFVFVGSVEDNMRDYLDNLLNCNMNVLWFGKVKKEKMSELYSMFDGIMIPYKNNEFIKATRPIKIVESVLCGIPVVTIPMDGYEENSFIRFADNIDSFSRQIDYLLEHPIDKASEEYRDFVHNNTWDCKAEIIIEAFEKIEENI